MDAQSTEILGRNRLVADLLQAGIEVAVPLRDRGVDLIAYLDLQDEVKTFIGRPIQMKSATKRSFSIQRKYERVRDLILAFVWHLGDPENAVTFAMTYPEAVAIGREMRWTDTPTWKNKGIYTTNSPSKALLALLEPFQMDPDRWRERISR